MSARASHGRPSAGMQYWQRKLQRSVTEMRTSPIGRPWPSMSCARRLLRCPPGAARDGSSPALPAEAALAARLLEQLDALDRHAGLDALDHVVDGQRPD